MNAPEFQAMPGSSTVADVQSFWEKNPLMAGETSFVPGSREFFEFHRGVFVDDAFAGELDERFFPLDVARHRVLDLGCGPGFWTVEFGLRGCRDLTAVDLTARAVGLTRERCAIYGVSAKVEQGNAEQLSFADGAFTHVNCQGVIHHTPDTEACVREIARVLEAGGTASVSVYYRNAILRAWPVLRWPSKVLAWFGAKMKGRGRENIYSMDDVDEIVRSYDGRENPIGKSYSRQEFERMLAPHFAVEEMYLHYFPARTLPFRLPNAIHRWLDRTVGFMIFATLRKV